MTDVYQREEQRAKKLAQVRGLLAKADSTKFPAEADTFRAKADELMAAYAIEAFEVTGHDDQQRRPEPIARPFDIAWYWTSDRAEEIWLLMQATARHCRVSLIYWNVARDSRTGQQQIPGVGMPADLDYFDMLFTHLYAQMGKGLEPKPDLDKPMIENLVTLKEAGMKWARIGELLLSVGQLGEPYTRKVGVRFTKLYHDYCEQHGREQHRTSPTVYQRSFAKGFVSTIQSRFREQREFQEQGSPQRLGVASEQRSTALVLADIRVTVERKAEELFGAPPRSRGRGRTDNRSWDMSAYGAGREAGRRADVSGAKTRQQVGSTHKQLPR